MRRFKVTIVSGLICILVLCINIAYAMETNFNGRVQSTFVLRDYDGFQSGVMDEAYGVQWRNEFKFDLTLRPTFERMPDLRLDKVFLSYRGAYDGIFEASDRYNDIREKSPADFELGEDDLEYENDLREAFADIICEGENQTLILRLGRQIVQWGEADGFNVLNILNPQDNRNMMFFENPDDLATPLWMARINYSISNIGPFQSLGLELVGIPEIRPHQFSILDDNMNAPYAFPYKQLKGKDIQFFHKLSNDLGFTSMGFDLGSINEAEDLLRAFNIPSPVTKWKEDVPANSFDNMEYGVKLEGNLGSIYAALHYFHGFQDDPAMDFGEFLSQQTLTFRHPEQDMYGFSFNMFLASMNAILRGEACMMDSMALVDFTDANGNAGVLLNRLGLPVSIPAGAPGYVQKKVYYGLLGFDKDFWMKWINPTGMIHTMWQGYWRHIDGWEYDPVQRPFDEQDSYRLTGFFWAEYMHGWIHPEIFFMYDPEGTWMTMASVKFSKNGKLFFKLTQMSFWGDENAVSVFTEPINLISKSELSFRIGYNW